MKTSHLSYCIISRYFIILYISWRSHGGPMGLVLLEQREFYFFMYCISALRATLCRHSVNICWGINGHMGASRKLMSFALLSQRPSFQMLSVDYIAIMVLETSLGTYPRMCSVWFSPGHPEHCHMHKLASVLRPTFLKEGLNTCELEPTVTVYVHMGRAYISE